MFSAAGKSAVTSGYNINNSLRLRSSASAYLNRTFTTPTNNKIWTWSAWVKRGSLTSTQILFATSGDELRYIADGGSSGVVDSFQYNLSTGTYGFRTNATYRDVSAWYHIVVAVDTTQATAANRARIYINGVEASTDGTYGIVQNANTQINSATAHNIARRTSGSLYFDGYMTEVNFVDGQQLTPSSFGETDGTTGVWKPKKFGGSFGTNGFYLPFSDIATTSGSNAGLGKDFSGNGNYWTTNNISVTSGITYDAMIDSPTNGASGTQPVGNYCVGNPLDVSVRGSFSNANLTATCNGGGSGNGGSVRLNTFNFTQLPVKWYWESTVTNEGSGRALFGMEINTYTAQSEAWTGTAGWYLRADGLTNLTGATSFTNNDVMMFAYDGNTGKFWVGKNGTWTNSGVPASGTGQNKTLTTGTEYWLVFNENTGGAGTAVCAMNYGQRPFAYTPPTGFVAVSTPNLPDDTIKKGNLHMDATAYTGTNGSPTTQVISSNFQPDLLWFKKRSASYDHALIDSVRGINKQLYSNLTNAEGTDGDVLAAIGSTSFTVGNSNYSNYGTLVAWTWKAGGTSTVNTSGTISSNVSVNTTAGFSIVTYTGNGSTLDTTVGHGLGVAPKFIMLKNRSSSADWVVYHQDMPSWDGGNYQNQALKLNTSGGAASIYGLWSNSTSTVFKISDGQTTSGDRGKTNTNGNNYVAYCFAEIAGFSKFTTYTGNGSTDGPFVYLGFRPKFVMVKGDVAGVDWAISDSTRNTYNVVNARLQASLTNAEDTGDSWCDFLSNGFKIRSTNTNQNYNGYTFTVMAFAENPFKNALAR